MSKQQLHDIKADDTGLPLPPPGPIDLISEHGFGPVGTFDEMPPDGSLMDKLKEFFGIGEPWWKKYLKSD